MTVYSVNTIEKSYRTDSATKAADVAVIWVKRGMKPKAFATALIEGRIESVEVAITNKRETASALRWAFHI